jgi:meiotically up-regulated gene 157 (Mug157) protein
MAWSAFRPSDDAAVYGYNIPGAVHEGVFIHSVGAQFTAGCCGVRHRSHQQTVWLVPWAALLSCSPIL